MRVFISHCSKDKPAVEALALALTQRGFQAWFDAWEINAGDDIVASINHGLDEADAGLILFSRHSAESGWVEAEVSYLTYARIAEHKILIPIALDQDAFVPPLLRPLARRRIDEIDALVDALQGRKSRPVTHRPPELGIVHRVRIALKKDGSSGARVTVGIADQTIDDILHPSLPPALITACAEFQFGFRVGSRGVHSEAERGRIDSTMRDLGSALRELCLPGESEPALINLLDGCPVGTLVEVSVEAEGSELLGLPFEALRLRDDRLLATHPSVVMLRRPMGLVAHPQPPLAGPLKILVAVGAPDRGNTVTAALDHEHELQNILDAVEPMSRLDNAQVRILEVGHPEVIARAMQIDAYHVLHLSCHGRPGVLELEDEEGNAVDVTPAELMASLKIKGRPMPMVLRTSPGEAPYFSLNTRQKWLVELKPQRNAISEIR